MIPPINHSCISSISLPIYSDNTSEIEPTLKNLRAIGMVDEKGKLLFKPSIGIKSFGWIETQRLEYLLNQSIEIRNKQGDLLFTITQLDYLKGLKNHLWKHKGIQCESYLRGSFAAYIMNTFEQLERLIADFCSQKNIPLVKIKQYPVHPPTDVDWLDLCDANPHTLRASLIEFLASQWKEKNAFTTLQESGFIHLLIPKPTPFFPEADNCVIACLGNSLDPKAVKTDRVIGSIQKNHLFTRDALRFKITEQPITPESTHDFYQAITDRELKIVRLEPRHKNDFIAGLAAMQLVQQGHTLIEEGCTLEEIFAHGKSLNNPHIFHLIKERSKWHLQNPYEKLGFLISCMLYFEKQPLIDIAREVLQELHSSYDFNAIFNSPYTKENLYQMAFLLTCFEDHSQKFSAKWDENKRLNLFIGNVKVIFFKDIEFQACPDRLSLFSSFVNIQKLSLKLQIDRADPVFAFGKFEKVLLELTLQKVKTPLSQDFLFALKDYLLHSKEQDEKTGLAKLVHPWLKVNTQDPLGWTKALLTDYFKEGIALWQIEKHLIQNKDQTALNLYKLITLKRPNTAFTYLQEENLPKDIYCTALIEIINHPFINPNIVLEVAEKISSFSNQSLIVSILKKLPKNEAYSIWKTLNIKKPNQETLVFLCNLINDLIIEYPASPLKPEWIDTLFQNGFEGKFLSSLFKQIEDTAPQKRTEYAISLILKLSEEIKIKYLIKSIHEFYSIEGVNKTIVIDELYKKNINILQTLTTIELISLTEKNIDFLKDLFKILINQFNSLTPKIKAQLTTALQKNSSFGFQALNELKNDYSKKPELIKITLDFLSYVQKNNKITETEDYYSLWKETLFYALKTPDLIRDLKYFFGDLSFGITICGSTELIGIYTNWMETFKNKCNPTLQELNELNALNTKLHRIFPAYTEYANNIPHFREEVKKTDIICLIKKTLDKSLDEINQDFNSFKAHNYAYLFSMALQSKIVDNYEERINHINQLQIITLKNLVKFGIDPNPFITSQNDLFLKLIKTQEYPDFFQTDEWDLFRKNLFESWIVFLKKENNNELTNYANYLENNPINFLNVEGCRKFQKLLAKFKIQLFNYFDNKNSSRELTNYFKITCSELVDNSFLSQIKYYTQDPCIMSIFSAMNPRQSRLNENQHEVINILLTHWKKINPKAGYLNEIFTYFSWLKKFDKEINSSWNAVQKNEIFFTQFLKNNANLFMQFLNNVQLADCCFDAILPAITNSTLQTIGKAELLREWSMLLKEQPSTSLKRYAAYTNILYEITLQSCAIDEVCAFSLEKRRNAFLKSNINSAAAKDELDFFNMKITYYK